MLQADIASDNFAKADHRSGVHAVCHDEGSRGGYYFRPASSPSAKTKWKFHFMGGGWCNDEASCVYRSKSLLGSSKPWTQQLSKLWAPEFAGFYGLMDANTTNPFGDWNFVWPAYCKQATCVDSKCVRVWPAYNLLMACGCRRRHEPDQ
jgi:hypothetical protein